MGVNRSYSSTVASKRDLWPHSRAKVLSTSQGGRMGLSLRGHRHPKNYVTTFLLKLAYTLRRHPPVNKLVIFLSQTLVFIQ